MTTRPIRENVAEAVKWADSEHERLDRRITEASAAFAKAFEVYMAEEQRNRAELAKAVVDLAKDTSKAAAELAKETTKAAVELAKETAKATDATSRLSGEVGILKVIGIGIAGSLISLAVTLAVK